LQQVLASGVAGWPANTSNNICPSNCSRVVNVAAKKASLTASMRHSGVSKREAIGKAAKTLGDIKTLGREEDAAPVVPIGSAANK
jgi:hypothetical protein